MFEVANQNRNRARGNASKSDEVHSPRAQNKSRRLVQKILVKTFAPRRRSVESSANRPNHAN